MIDLAENSYGKSCVRVMKVQRDAALHNVKEWKVEVLLYGNFESCFASGDNSAILATDTMKNTVYSRARESAVPRKGTMSDGAISQRQRRCPA